MKKIFLTLAVLFMGLSAMAAVSYVRVNLTSGDPILLSFDSKPEISFLADGIKVTSTDTDAASFQFDEVDSIDFAESSEVENVADDSVRVINLPDAIRFENVPEGVEIRLFSLDGTQLYYAKSNGAAVITKSSYPHGVYVVVVGDSSFKVAF